MVVAVPAEPRANKGMIPALPVRSADRFTGQKHAISSGTRTYRVSGFIASNPNIPHVLRQ